MLLESLLATWEIFRPALIVAAVYTGIHFSARLYLRWLDHGRKPIPPRIHSERAEPCDYDEAIRSIDGRRVSTTDRWTA